MKSSKYGLCLACTWRLEPKINAFCYICKASRPLDWTTDNKSLDSFIMESWSNTEYEYNAYIQWVEYSRLTDVREMTSLRHQCTHIASWLDPTTNELIHVTLKQIDDAQSLDFYQVITSRVIMQILSSMLCIDCCNNCIVCSNS